MKKLASAQVKHKLGVIYKLLRESEGLRVIFLISCKLLHQCYQLAVQPAKDVVSIFGLSLGKEKWVIRVVSG